MSQKLKLDSSFYLEEAVVYGLVSQLPAYRLCFFLNEQLNLKLNRSKEDKTIRFKQKQFYYSRFEQEDKSRGIDWFLIANKNALIEEKKLFSSQEDTLTSLVISGVPLISNLKVMDYFFGYYGEPVSSLNSHINGELKDVSYVSTFQKIDIHSTKNIDNLLID